MKIAYLINQYPQASQSFIRREIRALEALGFEIDRFTVRAWDQELVDPADREEQARTRVILDAGFFALLLALLKVVCTRPLRFVRALRLALRLGKRGDRGRLYHLVYLAEACQLLFWLRQAGSQHVHAHFGTNSAAVALLVRILGGPAYSFTVHGPEEFDRPLALRLDEKIRRAAFVVAISHFGRSQLMRWSDPDQWEKIHIVRCGVDEAFLASSSLPQVPENHRLVCIGRLAEQKGQLLLIRAALRLKQEGIPFHLMLIGDGPLRRQIEGEIARHGLSDQIQLSGWLNNQQIREQILASRALILPSFAEGLPVVLMEALALRRPVIGTFVAGVPELVEPGVNGYLVPAGNVDLLTAAMRRMLSEPIHALRAMGQQGAERVAREHDAATQATLLGRLFRTAALSASGDPSLAAASPA